MVHRRPCVAGKMRGTLPRHHSCLNPWHIHVYSLLSPSYILRIKTSHPYAGYPPSVTSDTMLSDICMVSIIGPG